MLNTCGSFVLFFLFDPPRSVAKQNRTAKNGESPFVVGSAFLSLFSNSFPSVLYRPINLSFSISVFWSTVRRFQQACGSIPNLSLLEDAASIENENASPSSLFLFVFKSALSLFIYEIYERKKSNYSQMRGRLSRNVSHSLSREVSLSPVEMTESRENK